jgi:hypothetical protein
VCFAVAKTLDEQLEFLDLTWPDVYKLLELSFFFEESVQSLWATVQGPNHAVVIRDKFNRCWRGLQAFQHHQRVQRVGDICLRMYSKVQAPFGAVVVFEREMSPVRRAMVDAGDGAGVKAHGISPKKTKTQMPLVGHGLASGEGACPDAGPSLPVSRLGPASPGVQKKRGVRK